MDNGSRTLVAVAAILGASAMACFKVISGQDAIAVIGTVVTAYFAIKTFMVDKNPPNTEAK